MDRLIREGSPPVGQLASPVPQYKRPGSTDYEPVEGQHGAPFATLKDASGNVVSPATEDKLEQVRQLLAGVATENKLEQARLLLDAISTKDFATSSKQDALNIAVEDLKSELILVKSELANIKANQLSGNQKVTLSGTIMALDTETNEPKPLSVLEDDKGNYVLRVVDSAPFAYDPTQDRLKVELPQPKATITTVASGVTIAPSSSTSGYRVPVEGNEKEIWIWVAIDKQPWGLQASYDGNLDPSSSRSMYPERGTVTKTHPSYLPCKTLWMGQIVHENNGLVPPENLEDAKKYIVYLNDLVFRVWNFHETETATATIRVLKVYK